MSRVIEGMLVLPDYSEQGRSVESASIAVSFRNKFLLADKCLDWISHYKYDPGLIQYAHLLNSVRGDPIRKAEVDAYIEELGVLFDDNYQKASGFSLNKPYNIIPLLATYHLAVDSIGSFLPTPSVDTLDRLDTILKKSNDQWDQDCQVNKHSTRVIDFSDSVFSTPFFEILILKFAGASVFYHAPFQHSPHPSSLYSVSNVTGILHPSMPTQLPGESLPPFPRSPTTRRPSEQVNVLLLTLFCACRLRSRSRQANREEITWGHYQELVDKIKVVDERIRYRPEKYEKKEEEKVRARSAARAPKEVGVGGRRGRSATGAPADRKVVTAPSGKRGERGAVGEQVRLDQLLAWGDQEGELFGEDDILWGSGSESNEDSAGSLPPQATPETSFEDTEADCAGKKNADAAWETEMEERKKEFKKQVQ